MAKTQIEFTHASNTFLYDRLDGTSPEYGKFNCWQSTYGTHAINGGTTELAGEGVRVGGGASIPLHPDFSGWISTAADYSYEFWVKFLTLPGTDDFMYCEYNSSYYTRLRFTATNVTFRVTSNGSFANTSVSTTWVINTWYHIYCSSDSTSATNTNFACAVNGTAGSTLNTYNPSINFAFNTPLIIVPTQSKVAITDFRVFDYLKYGPASTVPFTPTPRTQPRPNMFPARVTVDKSAYTPYYVPFLRGGQLG